MAYYNSALPHHGALFELFELEYDDILIQRTMTGSQMSEIVEGTWYVL